MFSYPCIAWFHAWRSNWGACAHAVCGKRMVQEASAANACWLCGLPQECTHAAII